MNSFSTDANHRQTMIREDLPIGGFHAISSATANTWVRLLPHGNDASTVTNESKQLNIGNLRDDVLSLKGWKVKILNAGRAEELLIVDYESPNIILQDAPDYADTLPSGSIEYVLFPEVILPFGATLHPDATDDVELGFTSEDAYIPSRIVPYKLVKAGDREIFQTKHIDKLFYRFPTVDTTFRGDVFWGEHYVS